MIPDKLSDTMKNELRQMLLKPKYIECFMVKTPLVPLKKNHQTQLLFISLYVVIFSTQMLLVVPSK
jgi:hypothetical protein